MFDDLMGAYGSRFLLAAGGVAIALLLLVAILWIMRNRAPSPFVRGGRNRQPRLQVLDAAAVDARRRLVLVRRDDVEHLVMIGGPTDIVIESRILPAGAAVQEPVPAAPAAQPAPIPAAPSPARPKEQPVMIAEAEQPAPPANVATIQRAPVPEPVQIAQAEAPAVFPAPQPRIPIDTETERALRPSPVAEPRPQPQTFAPPSPAPIEASAAADILDAARQRVLPQQRIEPQIATPVPTQPAQVADLGNAAPASQPSDFQRILEDEMTSTLAAERIVRAPTPPVRPAPAAPATNMPRRDPEMAPITGADAALQNEVARIFGEMSVNRDK